MGNSHCNCISTSKKKRKEKTVKNAYIHSIAIEDEDSKMEDDEEVTPMVEETKDENMDCEEGNTPSVSHNRHFEQVRVNTINFHIPHSYDMKSVEYLGGGSYGNVVRTKTKTRKGVEVEVAIKKMHQPFASLNNARRVFREIRLLQIMRHDNVIRAIDLYTPQTEFASFTDVYVVTEYAGNTLYEILKSQRETGTTHLGDEHIRFILYQLLRALKYIHSANVMHRDLKPSNLSVTSECDLTVLDFGLARMVEKGTTGLSTYVMTRWYRAPEVIYWKIGSYDMQADVWSVGCIAAELMINTPLFPGEQQQAQYEMITQLCGCPDAALLDKIEVSNNPKMREVIEKVSKNRPRVNFPLYFRRLNPDISDDAIDFLDKVLVLDPQVRLTVEEALQHPYVGQYYEPADEPTVTTPFPLDEEGVTSIDEWKTLIWREIHAFKGDDNSPTFT